MNIISISDYKNIIKNERQRRFESPYDYIYRHFENLGYFKKNASFFMENASDIVSMLRKKAWESYLPVEREFTSLMLKKLIDEKVFSELNGMDAIFLFIESYPEYIYALILSNTQSRRSRAGKEFECIIELLFIGANIHVDSQGNIGKKSFSEKGLGKLVDLVSPGVLEYIANKRNTVLISAKTTLRERWQEVPEEMGRTGAREMFLATLDENISHEVFNTLYEANIQITTTKSIKKKFYENNNHVHDFESLLSICHENTEKWESYKYTAEEKEKQYDIIKSQLEKHLNHKFVSDYYKKRLENLKP